MRVGIEKDPAGRKVRESCRGAMSIPLVDDYEERKAQCGDYRVVEQVKGKLWARRSAVPAAPSALNIRGVQSKHRVVSINPYTLRRPKNPHPTEPNQI